MTPETRYLYPVSNPPPIFIEASNIDSLMETPKLIVGPKEFLLVIKTLRTNHADYYTYQSKSDKKFKIVVKRLYPKLNIEYIKPDLQEKGHKISSIINLMKNNTSIPLSTFLTH